MPKFTLTNEIKLRLVATLILKRLSDNEIRKEVEKQTRKAPNSMI